MIYILGDNGTSAEGGMYNEYTCFNGVQESVADILKSYDQLGGPMSYAHLSAGWPVAGDTRSPGPGRSGPTSAATGPG